jgi:hypothetical protein
MIEDRNLAIGTRLVGRYRKAEHAATVVEGGYRLEDEREFKSPSAAAMAITGCAVNGWRFWSLANGSPKPTPAPKKARKPQAKVSRVPVETTA